MMRAWDIDATDADGDAVTAVVIAPDESSACDTLLTHRDFGGLNVRVIEARARPNRVEILDLHLPDPEIALADRHGAGPSFWLVRHNDGLFHRDPSASLVSAPDAISALRIVLDADPYEGQPPYGVPAAYGPVVPFTPVDPYLVYVSWG